MNKVITPPIDLDLNATVAFRCPDVVVKHYTAAARRQMRSLSDIIWHALIRDMAAAGVSIEDPAETPRADLRAVVIKRAAT